MLGIFSRFFVSGFFLPAFFTLFVLWLSVSEHFQPASFAAESKQVQLLVLGGLALLIGPSSSRVAVSFNQDLRGLRHPKPARAAA
jgi:hypothetical protein